MLAGSVPSRAAQEKTFPAPRPRAPVALDAVLARYHARAIDPVTGAHVLSMDAFSARATVLSEEFNGLLDADAIGLLILDELGLNEGAIVTLSECAGRAEASVRVRIDAIDTPRSFENERGDGRVVNLAVSDPTGQGRLTLWNKDVERVEDGGLKVGDIMRVLNARLKDTKFGLELHGGQWTVFEVEGAMTPARRKLLDDVRTDAEVPPASGRADDGDAPSVAAAASAVLDGRPAPTEIAPAWTRIADIRANAYAVNLRARVVSVKPTRSFQRKDGSVGFVANAEIADGSGRIVLTAWDAFAKELLTWVEGAEVEVCELVVRERYGILELHTTRESRLTMA